MTPLDLDALAAEPLVVNIGGEKYKVAVTVGVIVEAGKGDQSDPMELTQIIMEKAGMPREVFQSLSIPQAAALSKAITERFFPEVAGPARTDEPPSAGPTPSSASSEFAVEPTSTETT